ncbi:MAG: serine hydrolase [Caldilineaceae bacterium]|nr:serine hydrolase [Caldilineaceae bacterium]MBP8125494.1 serine hydrolase [Caldilineaceae bacterium]MBP9074588.1 serine hydrolase [Caldilineaceae bacterium]
MRKLITITLVVVGLLMLTRLYSNFKISAAPVPPGVTLGGVDVAGLKDPAEIQATLERAFADPIAVYYGEDRVILRPQDVDFQVDAPAMLADASRYLEGNAFVEIALRYALSLDQRPRDVPLRFSVDSAKLTVWLQTVADTYNRPPASARALPPGQAWAGDASAETVGAGGIPGGYVGEVYDDWRWVSGTPGYQLDMAASPGRLAAALASPTDRRADLVLNETPPSSLAMADLARALNQYLLDFPGLGSVYVEDLGETATQGQIAAVDVDVSFSGMSTMKIAIVSALFQRMEGLESAEIGQLMDYALGESNNYAANLMLNWLGGGDTYAGARVFTQFARELGMVNTYMQSGYDDKSNFPQISTPGNSREDWNTDPDTHVQSSPREMGEFLSAIYRCSQGEGLYFEVFPADFTPDECETILFYMTHDTFRELVWAGLPDKNSVWLVHKHGFANETHSDVALIWGPTGPYVISVFLYRPVWMDWSTSNNGMKALSRITWRFFEFKAQQEGITPPPPPQLTPPADYLPVPLAQPAAPG